MENPKTLTRRKSLSVLATCGMVGLAGCSAGGIRFQRQDDGVAIDFESDGTQATTSALDGQNSMQSPANALSGFPSPYDVGLAFLRYNPDDGIDGGVTLSGEERSSDIIGYEWVRHRSDSEDYLFIIEKPVDSASPALYRALSEGLQLRDLQIVLYRVDPDGRQEVWYSITLSGVRLISIRSYAGRVDDGRKSEVIEFVGQTVSLDHTDVGDGTDWSSTDGN